MLSWKRQGPAYIAAVVLDGGESATAVALAEPGNPAGMAVIYKGEDGNAVTLQYPEAAACLRPGDLIEIYCMQERAFGKRGLPKPAACATA